MFYKNSTSVVNRRRLRNAVRACLCARRNPPQTFVHSSICFSCFAPHSSSVLKLPKDCEFPQFAATSAPTSKAAMTFVAQPYCSDGENRLYTSLLLINCSAYHSNFARPSGENPPPITEKNIVPKVFVVHF